MFDRRKGESLTLLPECPGTPTLRCMRWEGLFADLDAQFAAEGRLERDAEVAERTRRERALVTLGSRLSAARGERVSLRLAGGVTLIGPLLDLGSDWLLVRGLPADRETLVPLRALRGVEGLPARAAGSDTARRFGLGSALRTLSRDRATVAVADLDGFVRTGTIDRVGADFLDLAEHPVGEARRDGNVRATLALPVEALVSVTAV